MKQARESCDWQRWCRLFLEGTLSTPRLRSRLLLPEEMHAGSLHLQTHNPLSKAPIQLCALSQAATVTRLDTDRKLGDALAHPPASVTLHADRR